MALWVVAGLGWAGQGTAILCMYDVSTVKNARAFGVLCWVLLFHSIFLFHLVPHEGKLLSGDVGVDSDNVTYCLLLRSPVGEDGLGLELSRRSTRGLGIGK